MAVKNTSTRALILAAPGTELTLSMAEFAPLISDWHAALDRRVAAGELAPATRSAYTIGAARFIAWAQALAPVTRETL